MNIPGRTIEVGVTRVPTAPLPLSADPTALLTDKDRLLPLLQSMSREALYSLAGWCEAEADRRIQGQLVDVMRALFHVEPEGAPVAKVEFVTNPNYEDGMYWDDETVYLHDADGHVTEFADFTEGTEGEDPAYAALDEEFRDLLADYSRQDRPADGAHLIVDLRSGAFTESSRYSLV
ncbi:hypothetical protein ACIQ9R_36120 [Streptomyces sp. NPDC094447]|uniref:hypothetical protein n=1 Tax=Streptomyces sp. NPDC094447 TaxID=3366062 RepID=UPI003811C8D7